jgi:hypothetical protein
MEREDAMMKRWMVVMGLVLLAAIGSYGVLAQPQSEQSPMGRGMGRGMMQGPGGQGGMMCPMCGAMGGAMLQKSMVQTEGGVIVAMGNKLIKYDADLNKVKEITLDVDISGMQRTMQQVMENCPMHRQMRQQQGTAQEQ